eukprot:TRINITY_DN69649_c0_g1_i1.p1 TRINITY_DN69649_c0_g1~~TRINITY_DN69649_c0_g1_i1.p1  ORF type:complete len:515 (-),score=95.51 TRINITY_DN69649_c0_g1_i1:77-1621(-)
MPQGRDEADRWRNHDFYDVLGVSSSAKLAEIKKGFRRVALTCHPDKVPEHERETATRRFQLIAEAYEVLSKDESRRRYDLVARVRTGVRRTGRQRENERQRETADARRPSAAEDFRKPSAEKSSPFFGFGRNNLRPCGKCDGLFPVFDLRSCSGCEVSKICSACASCSICIRETERRAGKAPSDQQRSGGYRPAAAETRKGVPESRTTTEPSGASPSAQPASQTRSSQGDPVNCCSEASQSPGSAAAGRSPSAHDSTPTKAAHSAKPALAASLMSMGYAEKDAEAAATRCSSIEAAVDFLLNIRADCAQVEKPVTSEAGPLAEQAEERDEEEDAEPPLDMFDMLKAFGFSEADARSAIERCSSVEAAVEYIMSHSGERQANKCDVEGRELEKGSCCNKTEPETGLHAATQEQTDLQPPPTAAPLRRAFVAPNGLVPPSTQPPPTMMPAASRVSRGLAETSPYETRPSVMGRSDLLASLLALGFRETQAQAAAQRCSSLEAAVEWISIHPGLEDK